LRAELTRSDNPPIGNTMVWTASGEVNGTVDLLFGGGSRDNDWNRLYGKDDRLGNNFEAFRTGRFQLYTDYSSMFSHILSDGINDAKYIWPVIAAL
jgi:hypothetical protein